MATEGVLPTHETGAPAGVWRGSSWLMQSRCACACLLLLITLLRALATSPSPRGIPAALGSLGLVALLWEWRARRMGLRITDDGVVAKRVVGSVHVRWGEIASFFARDTGIGLWGVKTIRVQRRQHRGVKVPGWVGMKLPTLAIVSPTSPLWRWLGPCDLVCNGTTIPQDRIVDFLNEQLASRRAAP
jgi:hypothetical protein